MDESDALRSFATSAEVIRAQSHIKPIHRYVACRPVLEGGSIPDEVMPRQPFRLEGLKGGASYTIRRSRKAASRRSSPN